MNRGATNTKKAAPSSSTTTKKTRKKTKPKASGSTAAGKLDSSRYVTDEQQVKDDVKYLDGNDYSQQKAGRLQRSLVHSPTTGSSISDDRYSKDISHTDAAAHRPRDTISLSLLAKRCINDSEKVQPDQIMHLLNEITHVRLDRENLQKIDGLELLGHRVRNLYLQHNEIKEIAGLETLTELKFLTLSNNHITEIRYLKNTKLGFLDLSHNSIDHISVEELPTSLMILNLEGNPCQLTDEDRVSILRHCHQLSQLNGDLLTVDERRAAGHDVTSESEDSDVDESTAPYNYDRPFDAEVVGVFDDLSSDLFLRCQARIQHVFDEHKTRVLNLEKIKSEGGIATEDGAVSNPVSRISSRLDSPDTTDSSRPDTGRGDINKDFDSNDVTLHTDDVDFVTSDRQLGVTVRGSVSRLHNTSITPSTLRTTMLQQAQAWDADD